MLLEHVDDKMGEWVSVKVGGKIAKTDLVARFARLVSIPLGDAALERLRPAARRRHLVGGRDIVTQQIGRLNAARQPSHQLHHAGGRIACLAPIARLHAQHRELGESLRRIGFQGDRTLARFDRILEMAVSREGDREPVLRLGEIGLEADSAYIMRGRLICIAAPHQRVAEIVMDLARVRPQREGLLVMIDGILDIAAIGEHIGEVVVGGNEIRPCRQGLRYPRAASSSRPDCLRALARCKALSASRFSSAAAGRDVSFSIMNIRASLRAAETIARILKRSRSDVRRVCGGGTILTGDARLYLSPARRARTLAGRASSPKGLAMLAVFKSSGCP